MFLDMAVLMSTINIHSGLHLLLTHSVRYKEIKRCLSRVWIGRGLSAVIKCPELDSHSELFMK